MQDKSKMKKELLEMLRSDMKEMMMAEKGDIFSEMMPKEEDMTKVTVAGDSPESVEAGLSKAQQIMKSKLGHMGEDSDDEMDEEMHEKMMKKLKKTK